MQSLISDGNIELGSKSIGDQRNTGHQCRVCRAIVYKVVKTLQFLNFSPGMKILEEPDREQDSNLTFKLLDCWGIFLLLVSIISTIWVLLNSKSKLWMQMSTTDYTKTLESLSIPASSETVPLNFKINLDKKQSDTLFQSSDQTYSNVEDFLCANVPVRFLNHYHKVNHNYNNQQELSFFKITMPYKCSVSLESSSFSD